MLFVSHTNFNCKIGGLIWVVPWNSLQHSVASAFLAVLYSDYMLTSQTEFLYCSGKMYKPVDLRKFAISQVCMHLLENDINNFPSLSLGLFSFHNIKDCDTIARCP